MSETTLPKFIFINGTQDCYHLYEKDGECYAVSSKDERCGEPVITVALRDHNLSHGDYYTGSNLDDIDEGRTYSEPLVYQLFIIDDEEPIRYYLEVQTGKDNNYGSVLRTINVEVTQEEIVVFKKQFTN